MWCLTMGEKLTIMELRRIRKYLSRVYPGVSDQDDLWDILVKLDKMILEGVKKRDKGK